MRAVADAGPLHHVVLIGEIGIVPELVGEVLIPPEVRDELDRPRTPAPVRAWIVSPPAWLLVRSAPPGSVEDFALAPLDTGERAAIALASEGGADVVLMDDRAGVTAARARGLPTVGTLGLLQRGARRALLDLPAAYRAAGGDRLPCAPGVAGRAAHRGPRTPEWSVTHQPIPYGICPPHRPGALARHPLHAVTPLHRSRIEGRRRPIVPPRLYGPAPKRPARRAQDRGGRNRRRGARRGPPPAGYDFQVSYMAAWCRGVGITDVSHVEVEKTLYGPEADTASRAAARAAAEALAATI